ncbi:aminotransferase class I/II-fold pyridoxal phosphate-dependent enzyme [Pseudozobellia thermophila]|uniref:7-keto-8-aminopelargonate synthetase n=1 Tax=Pseudozobellia thermophila TaxID=192903 RepID=A0A1M6FPT0_9FLAO|nr:aminotransferase class I/II-fold pyridoxal phosphate-dependent enzyme [Pseudozobellia thermophila]SHI99768.1 7-keto-8-aminopelargonate synthetase [Pseudozobellia thermophila]
MAYSINSFPGRVINIKGDAHLYFGGTAYLGLQTDAEFQEMFIKNVKRYGTNYGASRKSNVQVDIFDKAEAYLADLVGCPKALTLSSGYLAGQLISQTFRNKKHPLFYAPNTHAALYQTETKTYTTFTALNIAVREQLSTAKQSEPPVVFLDAIDFSGCNHPDFEALRTLPLGELILVVDDSHGIGIVGENGGGVYKTLRALQPKELVVCCSLGKGFAIQAGAIFATQRRIDLLKATAFFGGASPASPAAMATLLDAHDLYAKKRRLLRENIDYFTKGLVHKKKFHFMPDHPAFTFSDVQLSEYLEAHHIVVTNFAYPDEDSQIMSRIVLSAAHEKKDIDHLLNCINVLPKI